MAEFNPGDKVLVNGALVAEIVTYHPETNNVLYKHPVGGGINTVTAHITHTKIEHLNPPAVDGEPELPLAEEVDYDGIPEDDE